MARVLLVALGLMLPACSCSTRGGLPIEQPVEDDGDAAITEDGGRLDSSIQSPDAEVELSDAGPDCSPDADVDANLTEQDSGADAGSMEPDATVEPGHDSGLAEDAAAPAPDASMLEPCEEIVPGAFDWVSVASGDYGTAVTAVDLAARADGGFFITGFLSGEVVFGAGLSSEQLIAGSDERDTYVASYAADGRFEWATHIAGGIFADGNAVAALPAGSVVVVGDFQGSATFGLGESNETTFEIDNGADSYVARYTRDGALAWVSHIDGVDLSSGVVAIDAVDLADGSVLVTGEFTRDARFGAGEANETTLYSVFGGFSRFAARYDMAGQLVSAKLVTGEKSVVRADGSTYVLGSFGPTLTLGEGEPSETTLTSAGNSDMFIARYDSAGALLWARSAGGLDADGGRDLAVMPDGSVTVVGVFRGDAIFGDGEAGEVTLHSVVFGSLEGFVAHYDAGGTLAWAIQLGAEGHDLAHAAVAGADGTVLVAGQFESTVIFGAGETHERTLDASGMYPYPDLFIAEYDLDGALRWARSAGGGWEDSADSIDLAPDGAVLVAGRLNLAVQPQQVTATFGLGTANETMVTTRGAAAYVARYGMCVDD